MELRLLGPVELHVDGQAREIGPPQRQAVLVALAVDAGAPVPLETLVDRVWDESPPNAARAAIYAHITRLRRVLHGCTGPRGRPVKLHRRSSGYVLEIDPETVDLHRFRRLLADTRLGEALRLWRGPPLAGTPGQWIARLRLGIEQELVGAASRWALAELRSGPAEPVIHRLTDLVAAYPFEEELVDALMRALCAAGRVTEAQAQYTAMRTRLSDQLGASPGPELQTLYAAIQRGDLPTIGPPWAPLAVRQLPVDVAGFTGRRPELTMLHDALLSAESTRTTVVLAIDGPGGIGKSGLAIHASHQVARAFPDGQLYVDLRGATDGLPPLDPGEVLSRFLRALGVPDREIPHQMDEAAARYRTLLSGRRLLVLLDNATDEAQARPLLPAAPGCAALVTSRQVLAGLATAGHHLHLDTLTTEDAVELLGVLIGPARVAAEPQPATAIARCCGHFPLALRIAGTRLTARPEWPLAAMARRLARRHRRLDELQVADRGIRVSFAVSYQHLRRSGTAKDRAAADAFATLGTWDGPDIGVPVAARLLDRSEDHAERSLERLADAGLLEPSAPGRYRLHDLLRLYARELATAMPPASRADALARVMDYYIATSWHALALLRPGDPRLARARSTWSNDPHRFTDATAALAWLEAERANLLTAATQAAAVDLGAKVYQLAPAVFVFYLQRGHWNDCIALNQVALTAAEYAGDLAAQAQALCDLGAAHEFRGRTDEALSYIQRSLAIHDRLDDRSGQGAILNNLAVIHYRHGRHVEALTCARRSLAIHQELGSRNGQALNLDTLAAIHSGQRRYREALSCYRRSLTIHRELGSRWDEAKVLNGLGAIYTRLHRYHDALTCVRHSLTICDRLNSDAGRASNLDVLGTIHHAQGRYTEALECFQKSIGTFRRIGQLQDVADALHHAATTLQTLGRTDAALAIARQANAIRTHVSA